MEREKQREFVIELMASIQKGLLADLDRVPAEWDGFELRQWIADRTHDSATMAGGLKGKRKRDYNNTVIVNNL